MGVDATSLASGRLEEAGWTCGSSCTNSANCVGGRSACRGGVRASRTSGTSKTQVVRSVRTGLGQIAVCWARGSSSTEGTSFADTGSSGASGGVKESSRTTITRSSSGALVAIGHACGGTRVGGSWGTRGQEEADVTTTSTPVYTDSRSVTSYSSAVRYQSNSTNISTGNSGESGLARRASSSTGTGSAVSRAGNTSSVRGTGGGTDTGNALELVGSTSSTSFASLGRSIEIKSSHTFCAIRTGGTSLAVSSTSDTLSVSRRSASGSLSKS